MKTYNAKLTMLRAISKCYLSNHNMQLQDAVKYDEHPEHHYHCSGAREAASISLEKSNNAKKAYMDMAKDVVKNGDCRVVVDGNLVYVESI